MEEHPSKLKSKKERRESTPEALPPELDISSSEFDPLKALYADPAIKLTKRKPKVIYQNFAAFESDFNKNGLYGLSSKSKDATSPKKKTPATANAESSAGSSRRFLPHQMAIQTTGQKMRNKRSLLKQIDNMTGPMAVLRDFMRNKRKITVYTRSEHGVRGIITGHLISFDKHWNLLLRNVQETWRRRKYMYDQSKFSGTPTDCSERLRELGIKLPEVKVKSLSRKTVEVNRNVAQILLRGEQVVLVATKMGPQEEATALLKSCSL